MSPSHFSRHLYQLMSTVSILSILVYTQSGYLLVYHMGLSLVHCSYLSIGSLQNATRIKLESKKSHIIFHRGDVFQNGVFWGWMGAFLRVLGTSGWTTGCLRCPGCWWLSCGHLGSGWRQLRKRGIRNRSLRRRDIEVGVTCVHVLVMVHRSGQCRISYV